jgi:hypothetical protein
MISTLSSSITPLPPMNTTSNACSTATEEAWRMVEQRAALPPVVVVRGSRKEWCHVVPSTTNVSSASGSLEIPEDYSSNIQTSNDTNQRFLLPLKKRRRFVLHEDDNNTNPLESQEQQDAVNDEAKPVVIHGATIPPQPRPENICSNEQVPTISESRGASTLLRCASKLLPHLIPSNQDIYNKNGHIGIYDPQQRAAILSRFHKKRLSRKFRKRIRYDCRKDLAEKRVRVKGRFVKGSVTARSESPCSTTASCCVPDVTDIEAEFEPNETSPFRRVRRVTVP